MNKRKIGALLCGLNLVNAQSDGMDKNITHKSSIAYQMSNEEVKTKFIKGTKIVAVRAAIYCVLNRIARLFINTGNLKTQKIINFFRGNKNSKNWASVPVSQYKNLCKDKFWSEQKLKSGGRMITYSPKENVKKVWICFPGCSSYGLDVLEDVWRSTVPVEEPNTAFVAIDYPGYGIEAPGNMMNKRDLKTIADEVVDKISEKYDSAEKCIHGHSLGTFPASWKSGDDRIKEIHLHSPVNLSKIPNKVVGKILVLLNAENLNSIDNLITQGSKRKTMCKVTIVSGGRKKS